jgi:hypothetical protein
MDAQVNLFSVMNIVVAWIIEVCIIVNPDGQGAAIRCLNTIADPMTRNLATDRSPTESPFLARLCDAWQREESASKSERLQKLPACPAFHNVYPPTNKGQDGIFND